ncbi:trimeric intracellular cation channel family protein [Gottfriedia acidiceleris]|uniref:Trimeric intracellular cation channel family protein n=1 Tax=Gottfriedia acidiceleris TaxID=371036 RepID=A0ABY4JGD7_9BACI|nr:trimeric intracellular cation channel family protein [Gottfriedia acidiceleris]UPM52888.1 trimeric intracellular cation channel family protein [Gottfriedia acidiceleris]
METWDLFSIIGTISFALSGAVVAMEEDYDLFGVYILGFATAFGGGALRNLLIGYPINYLWNQTTNFTIALVAMTIIFFFPQLSNKPFKKLDILFDSIGLSAFAILGANYAMELKLPVSAVIVASVLTGIGGGIVRDLLAKRKPMVLHSEVYAFWAILVGVLIGNKFVDTNFELLLLFIVIVLLRLLSVHYNWSLPKRSFKDSTVSLNESSTQKLN